FVNSEKHFSRMISATLETPPDRAPALLRARRERLASRPGLPVRPRRGRLHHDGGPSHASPPVAVQPLAPLVPAVVPRSGLGTTCHRLLPSIVGITGERALHPTLG